MKTINFLYWMHNYGSKDLPAIFKLLGDREDNKHFENMFSQCWDRANGTALGTLRFMMSLSEDNKKIVLDWVDKNYDSGMVEQGLAGYEMTAYEPLKNYISKSNNPELQMLFMDYLKESIENLTYLEEKFNIKIEKNGKI